MKAVILAAGNGTRFRPLTYTKPKVLLTVANKPIIQHIVDDLISLKIDEIFIVTNYLEEKIKKLFSSYKNIKFVHQDQVLGTGDAFSKANFIDETFVGINGDEVFNKDDLVGVIKKHKEKNALVTVSGFRVNNPERFGVLDLEVDMLKKITEKPSKPPSNLVNAGLYVFEPEIFDLLKKITKTERGEYEVTDAINFATESKRVFCYTIKRYWQGLSMLWELLDANKIKLEEAVKEKGKNLILGENVEIKSGVCIEGNVMIGPDSVIGPNCYIRDNTSVGKNCRIGNGVEIKNSIIMDNTKIPHLSYIGDSIIGENCNLGAGTLTANLRHDNKNVKVLINGNVLSSGKRKLGAFLADYTKTGIGTMIYPGMIIGPCSWTAPNAKVDKNIEPFRFFDGEKKLIDKEKLDMKDDEEGIFLKNLFERLKDIKY